MAVVRLLWLLVTACLAPAAHAGSMRIDPVRIELSRDRPTAVLTVTNSDSSPLLAHVDLSLWAQVDGIDQHEPSRDLYISPPIFELAPGARQLVRIGLRDTTTAPGVEQSYRIFVREVPVAQPSAGGMRVALRIGIPVFVLATNRQPGRVEWQAERAGDRLSLIASNTGYTHVQLRSLRLLDAHNKSPLADEIAPGYLLPGATRRLEFADPRLGRLAAGDVISIRAVNHGGEITADVVLAQ